MRNRSPICRAIAVGLGLAASHPAGAADGRAVLQAACWQPSALSARPGENIAVRLHRPAAMRIPNPTNAAAPVPAPFTGVVRRVTLPAGRKLVALTFDLCEMAGETAGYDGAIIDYLRSQRLKATLFAAASGWFRTKRAPSNC